MIGQIQHRPSFRKSGLSTVHMALCDAKYVVEHSMTSHDGEVDENGKRMRRRVM